MANHQLGPIMIALALLTPALGFLMLVASRAIERDSGAPASPIMRRAALILFAAGPLNLLIWLSLNQWLDAVGYRSVLGYALPAAAFFIVGWATGFFARMKARITPPRARDSAVPSPPRNAPANRADSPAHDAPEDTPAPQ